MSKCAHSVGVVVTESDSGIKGCTVTGYISINSNPDLFGIVLRNDSSTLKGLLETSNKSSTTKDSFGTYSFNLLSEFQSDFATKFATNTYSRSMISSYYTSKDTTNSVPYLSNCVCNLFLKYHSHVIIGSSTLVIGEVTHVMINNDLNTLVYVNRSYSKQ